MALQSVFIATHIPTQSSNAPQRPSQSNATKQLLKKDGNPKESQVDLQDIALITMNKNTIIKETKKGKSKFFIGRKNKAIGFPK